MNPFISSTGRELFSNSCRWNPDDKASGVALSNNDLTMSTAAGTAGRANHGRSKGRFYFEIKNQQFVDFWVGICNRSSSLTNYPGVDYNGIAVNRSGATPVIYINGSLVGNISVGPNYDDSVCMAINFDRKLFWAKVNNGIWNNDAGADPSTNTGGISIATLRPGPYYPANYSSSGSSVNIASFKNSTHAWTVPAGYDGNF